jgi:hypothetical protein
VIVVSGGIFRLTAGLPSTAIAASVERGSAQQSRPNPLLFWCRRLELERSPNRKRGWELVKQLDEKRVSQSRITINTKIPEEMHLYPFPNT